MPLRPPDPFDLAKWLKTLEGRVYQVERRNPPLPESAKPLQTYENGGPLGETRFLDFGRGIHATRIDDGFVQVTVDSSVPEFDAIVDINFGTSQPSNRLFIGIGEAETYLKNTVGLTSAAILVRDGNYAESAAWNSPATVHLFAARGSTRSGTGGQLVNTVQWNWNGFLPLNQSNTSLHFIDLEVGAMTGGVTSPFATLTAYNSSIMYNTVPTPASPFALCSFFSGVNCKLQFTMTTGAYIFCNDSGYYNNCDLILSGSGLTNPSLTLGSNTVLAVGGRWSATGGVAGPSITLPTKFHIDVMNSNINNAAVGVHTFTVPLNGRGYIHCGNTSPTVQPWSVSATSTFTELQLSGSFDTLTLTGVHNTLIVEAVHAGTNKTWDTRGPVVMKVGGVVNNSNRFIFRGKGVEAIIASEEIAPASGAFLSLIDCDAGLFLMSMRGAAASAPAQPYNLDASSTHNIIIWPELGSWPTAGTDSGTNNRIETTPVGSVAGGSAPNNVDYLVGTASSGLTAEIVVGTTPGGQLGGTWSSPTVDDVHGTSAPDAHSAYIAKAFFDAKGDLITASANDTPSKLSVGADGTLLIADSTQAGGLRWRTLTVADLPTTAFAQDIGDGVTTSIVVTHNLNTRDIIAAVRRVASPYDYIAPTIYATTVNTATIEFAVAPATNEYRVVIQTR